MGRVLVTGAAGFIGSHLVDRLLASGREVVGIDAFTGYYSRRSKERNLSGAITKEGFFFVEGDLLSLELGPLLRGVESIAHLAGEPGVRRSWQGFSKYVERNVAATQRLLEAAGGSPLKAFVYASSSSIYGADGGKPVREDHVLRPVSPYGLSKLAAEKLVALYARERDVPATMLRYFTVYGPRQRPDMAISRFISAALRGRPVEIFGDGEQAREMTYVEDAVEATVAALEGAGRGAYNIGGGARATVNGMLDLIRRATGRPVDARYGPVARGDVRSTWADTKRAARDLGYRPRVGLEEGMQSQVRWALDEIPTASTV